MIFKDYYLYEKHKYFLINKKIGGSDEQKSIEKQIKSIDIESIDKQIENFYKTYIEKNKEYMEQNNIELNKNFFGIFN